MKLRKSAMPLAMAFVLGLGSAAFAQDGESAPKSGKWFSWLGGNKAESEMNQAVALSSAKPWGLKKLGQRIFGPSKPKDEMAASYSTGDVRVNGGTAQVLGPGSYKLNSKGWQSSKSTYSR